MAKVREPEMVCTPISTGVGTAIVCAPRKSTCWCCDSSIPHGVPEMIVTDKGRTYCSMDCLDDWERHLEQQDAAHLAKVTCCPECGYDNTEHNPRECSKATERDFVREGVQRA